jgi:predicted LPLAT superfamily acyltransferase
MTNSESNPIPPVVDSDSGAHWSRSREAGTLFGLRFLDAVHTLFGRRVLSLILYPVVAYFYLVRSQARKASQQYLNQHFVTFPDQWSRRPGVIDGLRHFHEFAESVVDKLLSWRIAVSAGEFTLLDEPAVRRTEQETRGLLIIGSHHGSIENCRAFLQSNLNHVVNLLVYDKNAENYVQLMNDFNDEARVNIYQVDEFSIATMLLFREKVQRGEWVFVAGDRAPLSGDQRTIPATFLGREARFPVGPYLLAHALQCPVRLMFSWKNHSGSDQQLYFDVVEFAEKISLPPKKRDQRLEELVQAYAARLESVVRVAPFQWFNFFKYWDEN